MIETPIYVFGHKNPDLDAICAPIAYAAYKQAQGDSRYVAARCGNTHARIDAVLKHFSVETPVLIEDVTPRVKDVMVKHVHFVRTTSTCFDALSLMDQFDVRALPVVDENHHLQGIVSIFDLGQYFVPKPKDPRLMRKVKTNLVDIVHALKAQVHTLKNEKQIEDLFVRIASMELDSFGPISKAQNTPAQNTILLVGDRQDIQLKAIEMGVRLIVISHGWPVSAAVVAEAQKNGVSIISSSYDSATSAWIIRCAEQVSQVMQKNVVTCEPNEKLSQARKKISTSPVSTVVVVDENGRLMGVFSKGDLVKPVATQITLIDHNELSQAVDGASEVHILEIIDHHKLGNPPTQQPIFFWNEPLGSSCTIVAEMFQRAGLKPSASIAGLLMSGLISDTLNLRGPTTTPRDEAVLRWLEPLAGITAEALHHLIFSSGSFLLTMPIEKVVQADCKEYTENGYRYAISQIEEMGFDQFWPKADAILEALEAFRIAHQFYFVGLLVTDINTQNSLLLAQGNPDFIHKIQSVKKYPNGIFEMPGVVSRKKQLIPYLSRLLNEKM